jgi:hypothetical protein
MAKPMEFALPTYMGKRALEEKDEDELIGEERVSKEKSGGYDGPFRASSPPKMARMEDMPGKEGSKSSGSNRQLPGKGKPSPSRATGRAHLDDSIPGGLQEVVVANAELSVETAAISREGSGIQQWTILAKVDSPPIQAGLLEGKRYNKEAQEKKGTNIGAAHARIAVQFLLAMTTMKEFLVPEAAAFKAALEAFWAEFVLIMNKEELAEYICIFKVLKPKSPSKQMTESFGNYAKVIFKLRPMSPGCTVPAALEEQLLKHAKLLGWKVMAGTPPKTAKERKLQEALKNLRR